MVMENLNDLGEVCSIIFLDAGSDCMDLYMSHHNIYGVKIFPSSNFNPVSISLWYENIIIFFPSIITDSDKRGTMSATIAIFCHSVLGNTSNDTYCWLCFCKTHYMSLDVIEFQLFCPWASMNFFVHSCVWSLKSTLKPTPTKNSGSDNEITSETLPLTLPLLENEEEFVKVPKISFLFISP